MRLHQHNAIVITLHTAGQKKRQKKKRKKSILRETVECVFILYEPWLNAYRKLVAMKSNHAQWQLFNHDRLILIILND